MPSRHETLRRWQELAVRLEPCLARMPYAAADHAAFVEAIDRLEAAEHEAEFLRGRLAVLRGLYRQDEERARELRNRLAAFLRATFGPRDARLAAGGPAGPRRKRPAAGRDDPVD